MQAAVSVKFGLDGVQIRDVPKPVPRDHEVLIRVRAASVNPIDWGSMRGTPYDARIVLGLRKPRFTRPGRDVAGQVEAVGRKVTRFQPGDKAFGIGGGSFAEYVCAKEKALARKPDSLSYEQAAAIPIAGLTALQSLRDKGKIQPGQKVLINGASGGVGTFAVQLAKVLGAEVTGVCRPGNVDLVRSLGADRIMDRTREDFTRSGLRYDLICDCYADHSLSACRRALNPQGIYIVVGGPMGSITGVLLSSLNMLLWSRFVSQKFRMFMARASHEDLAFLGQLIEAGKIISVIDRCYSLSEVNQAIRHLAEGRARGKIVITVET